jgi:hypothetical protein
VGAGMAAQGYLAAVDTSTICQVEHRLQLHLRVTRPYGYARLQGIGDIPITHYFDPPFGIFATGGCSGLASLKSLPEYGWCPIFLNRKPQTDDRLRTAFAVDYPSCRTASSSLSIIAVAPQITYPLYL